MVLSPQPQALPVVTIDPCQGLVQAQVLRSIGFRGGIEVSPRGIKGSDRAHLAGGVAEIRATTRGPLYA